MKVIMCCNGKNLKKRALVGWLVVVLKSNCLLVGAGPVEGVPSVVGSF